MRTLLLAATCLSFALSAPLLGDAPAPDPAAAIAPIPLGKLTDAVRPVAYRLDLMVDPARDDFSGHVEIDTTLKAPSSYVDLHGRGLKMSKAVAMAGGQTLTGQWHEIEASGVARLVFDRALPAGPVTFSFDYQAPFGSGPAGLFHVKVGDEWYSWSQFESIDARAAKTSIPASLPLTTSPGSVGNGASNGISRAAVAGPRTATSPISSEMSRNRTLPRLRATM